MSGGNRDLSREGPPAGPLTVEVLIIGSGPAGATAALDLARAGKEVLILEEGVDPNGRKNQRDGAMYDLLYMDRGGRMTADLGVAVMQGRALGGGSVINISDVVPLSDPVLDHWRTVYGLSELTPANLEPHRRRALEDLHANEIPDTLYNLANQKLEQGAAKLGLAGERMQHNRVGCAGLGTCLLGCPLNAKKNARQVTLPRAFEAGARCFTRARALRVDDATKELKRVTVAVLDEKGYHETATFEVRAKTVILAANAVGSTQLVLRSGLGNAHAGRHLSLQPQAPVVADFDERIVGYRGVPQAFAVTEHEEKTAEGGLGGFRIEGVYGTPGLAGTLMGYSGHALKQFMMRYDHLAAALCLTPDEAVGTLGLHDDGRVKIDYALTDDNKARLRKAMKLAARAYLAAGASRVHLATMRTRSFTSEAGLEEIDALDLAPATITLISAHQQGGLRMAPSAKDGALDPDGQLYGARGVYAFDSAGFPSTSSSHTMTPIIAMASYLTARLLRA